MQRTSLTRDNVAQLQDQWAHINAQLVSLRGTISGIQPAMMAAARELQARAAQTALDQYALTQLVGPASEKIVGQLAKAGIRNLGDLFRQDQDQQASLPGLTWTESASVRKAAAQLRQSLTAQAPLRLDFDHAPDLSTAILRGTLLWNAQPQWQHTVEQLAANAPALQADLAAFPVDKLKRLAWFFTSARDKAALQQRFQQLSASVAQTATAVTALASAIETRLADMAGIKADFLANSAPYYAFFEAIKLPGTQPAAAPEGAFLGGTGAGETADRTLQDILTRMRQVTPTSPLLTARLRGWQDFGARFILTQKRVLLGDEMGLGKTIEALAVICALASQGRSRALVVSPLSTLTNWQREIAKQTRLPSFLIRGAERDQVAAQWARTGGVAVTNYEMVMRLDPAALGRLDILVVDEAHYVKNPDAKRSAAIAALAERVPYALFMMGTPLENRVEDMVHLVTPLRADIAQQLAQVAGVTTRAEFRRTIAPVYLRRTRQDVLRELPPIEFFEDWVDFGPAEFLHYRQAVAAGNFMGMRQAGFSGGAPAASPKLDRLLAICAEAQASGRKVIVFSFFRNVLTQVHAQLAAASFPPIMGGVSPQERQNIMDAFTAAAAQEKNVLCAQVNTAGFGLNLQAASVIIFCEPQIKPSLEEQALSRAYRMGQTNTVTVYRLLTADSVDERMLQMLAEKKRAFQAFAQYSDVAQASPDATDASDQALIKQLVAAEQQRLGVPVTAAR